MEYAHNVRIHIILHMRKVSSGNLLLISSNDSVSGQWGPEADLGLRCPHKPEATFWHDAVHIHKLEKKRKKNNI